MQSSTIFIQNNEFLNTHLQPYGIIQEAKQRDWLVGIYHCISGLYYYQRAHCKPLGLWRVYCNGV